LNFDLLPDRRRAAFARNSHLPGPVSREDAKTRKVAEGIHDPTSTSIARGAGSNRLATLARLF